MAEVILHIGTTKTGTSALQRFLFENRGLLAAHDIVFPVFTKQGPISLVRNGLFLSRSCLAMAEGLPPHSRANDPAENLEQLRGALSGEDRVLLTDECFSQFPSMVPGTERSSERFWELLAASLFDAGADTATIVVYLRRQDDWTASQWRQGVRDGWGGLPLKSYCKNRGPRITMDYAGVLEAARKAFGDKGRIVVRRYDRSFFEGGDIFHDFCVACDIPWDEAYKLPERDMNTSLSFDVAEALRAFRDDAPAKTPLRLEVIQPLAYRLTRQNPDPAGMTPFDEEATRELMGPYLEGNRQISETYLDGAPLFSDEYGGRPVWVPDEERIAECRRVIRQTIREHGSPYLARRITHTIARKLPEGIKRPLRAVRDRLFRR